MLSYFRINDPYRLAVIFVFLVLIRLTIFSSQFPELIYEMKWMVIGEKLGSGSNLYVDIWDNLPPLSGAVYQLVDIIFGRSPLTLHIFSLLLVFFQAFYFNNLMLKHRAYNESTYLPGLVYVLLMNLFYDFYTLSPVLMGITFILLALGNIFTQLGENRNDQHILSTGIFLGIANLFYYPAFFLLFVVFIAYAFLTGTTIRRYLLMVFGYLLPIMISLVVYYLRNGLTEYYQNFFASLINIPAVNLLDPMFYLYLFGFPLIFTLVAAFSTLQSSKFTNPQERIQKLMIIFLFGCLIVWFINRERAPYQLMLIVIPSAFFLAHYFLNIQVRWKAEVIFSLFVAGILFISISAYRNSYFISKMTDLHALEIQPVEYSDQLSGKKILYVGNNYSAYQNARLATPYFNWYLSRRHLINSGYYDNLTAIHNNFQEDLPEVIYDEMQVMGPIMEKMPNIEKRYRLTEGGKLWILNQ